MGHSILMGRKTFESIGKPLPGRHNLVVTRTGNFAGVELIRDLQTFDPALYEADGKEIFVIGGAEIYRALLVRCESIYVTIVKEEYEGDAYFPEFELPVRNFRDGSGNPGIRHFLLSSSSLICGAWASRHTVSRKGSPAATRRSRCDIARLPKACLLRTRVEHFYLSFALQQSDPIERHRGSGYCNQSERKWRCKERQPEDVQRSAFDVHRSAFGGAAGGD